VGGGGLPTAGPTGRLRPKGLPCTLKGRKGRVASKFVANKGKLCTFRALHHSKYQCHKSHGREHCKSEVITQIECSTQNQQHQLSKCNNITSASSTILLPSGQIIWSTCVLTFSQVRSEVLKLACNKVDKIPLSMSFIFFLENFCGFTSKSFTTLPVYALAY